MKSIILKLIIPSIIIILWQTLSVKGMQAIGILPPPSKVIAAILNLFTQESVTADIFVSVKHVAIGFSIASLTGIATGVLFGCSKTIKTLLWPVVEFLRPVPPISWIPLSILWFGIGDKPAYFLVFLGAFFPIMSSVYFGVISVEENHKRAALSLGAGRKELLKDIIFPASLPSIFTGLKTGLGISWFMVIVAELVGSQSGLGYMIQLNRLLLRTDKVIGGMVIIGACGFLMNKIMEYLEHRLIPWRAVS
jgi:NitT/TauT family transport system permease protein/sulfonate transport system permease protein